MDKFVRQDFRITPYINYAYIHYLKKTKDRARNYPEGTFHVDDGRLFCSSCNVVVDHLRKFVVDKHLEAASHKRNAERKDGGKQQTLKTGLSLTSH